MYNEEFYDSLEGDFSSPSNESLLIQNFESKVWLEDKSTSMSNTSLIVIKPPPLKSKLIRSKQSSNSSLSSPVQSKCSVNNNNRKTEENRSSGIPLYTGKKNVSRSSKSRKCCSTTMIVYNNKSNSANDFQKTRDDVNDNEKKTLRRKRTKKGNFRKESIQIEKVPSNSYLKIFHHRIGYPTSAKKQIQTDTNRSTCGDSERSSIISNSSSPNDFCDAEDNSFETASYYFQAITEAEKSNKEDDSKLYANSSNASCSSSASFEMASISEIFQEKLKSKMKTQKSVKNKLPPVPVLGSLGPETGRNHDKMELRQKQLKYGQKASYKNRIKLLEINILKNLKLEMEGNNKA
ncbi:hypothetical protein FQA39_LY15782 [Lamprigera yunnana]|nr:hypothetical protein FQA39_LY15782 [Lamprigera yunnana]